MSRPTLNEAVDWGKSTVAGMSGTQAAKLSVLIDAAEVTLQRYLAEERGEPIGYQSAELISEPSHDTAWIVAALLSTNGIASIHAIDALPALVTEIRSMMESE